MRPLQGCRSRGVVVGTVTLCLAAGWALQSKCPTPSLPPLLPPPAPSSCSRPRCPAQPQRLPTPARGQRNRERLGRGWGRDIPRLRQASLLCEGCAWSGRLVPAAAARRERGSRAGRARPRGERLTPRPHARSRAAPASAVPPRLFQQLRGQGVEGETSPVRKQPEGCRVTLGNAAARTEGGLQPSTPRGVSE